MKPIDGFVNEKRILDHFIEYLIESGFPKNSIAVGYRLKSNIMADIVIVDDKTNIPLMLFEIKTHKTSETEEKGKRYLDKIHRNFKDSKLATYLVFYNPKLDNDFEVLQYDANTGNYINDDDKPAEYTLNYEFNKVAIISEAKEEKESKKRETIETFKVVCWVIAFVIILMLIGSKVIRYTILTTDLILFGAAIVMILLPFVSKINFLGIEIEKYTNREK